MGRERLVQPQPWDGERSLRPLRCWVKFAEVVQAFRIAAQSASENHMPVLHLTLCKIFGKFRVLKGSSKPFFEKSASEDGI